jgi:hypothetical protein
MYLEEEDSGDEERMGGSGRHDASRQLELRGEEGGEEQMVLHERELMEGVTERTVEALRRLAKEGRISREHKRRLLTDVIEHHQVPFRARGDHRAESWGLRASALVNHDVVEVEQAGLTGVEKMVRVPDAWGTDGGAGAGGGVGLGGGDRVRAAGDAVRAA